MSDPEPRPTLLSTAALAQTSWRTGMALSLLGLSIAYSAAARVIFSPLQELAKAELHLSDFQLSLVQGLAASIPIALISLPIGRLVDRIHRARLLRVMIAISALGTLLTVVAQGMAFLFFARMLAGLGAVSAIPVAVSIAADLSRPERRGRALLYLSLGNIAGGAAAFALGGWLLASMAHSPVQALFPHLTPWRGVHLEFAVGGVIVFLCLLAVREPQRHELGESVGAPFRTALTALWGRRRLLVPLFAGYIASVMADTAAAIWAAPVLSRSYHRTPEGYAGWMGMVILVSGILGSFAGGLSADCGQRSKVRAGIVIGAVMAALVSIPAALYPVMPTIPEFAWTLGVFLLCGAIMGLTSCTVIAVLIPNELRGICMGVLLVIGGVIGFGVAPTLVSVIQGALGGEAYLATALCAVGVATSTLAFLGFVITAREITAPQHLSDRSLIIPI